MLVSYLGSVLTVFTSRTVLTIVFCSSSFSAPDIISTVSGVSRRGQLYHFYQGEEELITTYLCNLIK